MKTARIVSHVSILALFAGIFALSGNAEAADTNKNDAPDPAFVARVSAMRWKERQDPRIALLFEARARALLLTKSGQEPALPPWLKPNGTFLVTGRMPVVIRFNRWATAQDLERTPGSSRMLLASGAIATDLNESEIAAFLRDTDVTRISCAMTRQMPLPVLKGLDAAAKTGVANMRRALRRGIPSDGTEPLLGKGVTVADVDSGIDVFHPDFFHADGGYRAWFDVDGDGKLTPGIDGIDVNDDGKIEGKEILQRLSATVIYSGAAQAFTPDTDFLYLDENQDGSRTLANNDATPGFGEPLFILDDANVDGVGQTAEKLIRLGSSKVSVAVQRRSYRRGATGAQAMTSYRMTAEELEGASHGTGVSSILAGGTFGHSRWTGIAPKADLVAVNTGQSLVQAMQRAINAKPVALITEFAPYTGYPLDGTHEDELLLDGAWNQNVIPVSPAGNLADSAKHLTTRVTTTEKVLALRGDALDGAQLLQMTVLHRAEPREVKITWKTPFGQVVVDAQTPAQSGGNLGNVQYQVIRETSARGTVQTDLYMYRQAGPLDEGMHQLVLQANAGDPIEADIYVGDERHSWGAGFVFNDNTMERTICHPATSDKTIRVGAFVLNDQREFGPGGNADERAVYSSAGPRIDGTADQDRRGIDVMAPDNPISAYTDPSTPPNTIVYSPFGGTSGAGPHVAGVLTLMREKFPNKTALELRDMLYGNMRKDAFTTNANLTGRGKVDLSKVLGLSETKEADVKVVLKLDLPQNGVVKLNVKPTGGSAPYRYRFDSNYDGEADGPWQDNAEYTFKGEKDDPVWIKAEIVDADGNLGTAVIRTLVGLPPEEPVSPPEEPKGPTTPAPSASSATSSEPAPQARPENAVEDSGCGCGVQRGESTWLHSTPFVSAIALVFFRRKRAARSARSAKHSA
jgi:subtilisin family serine protease